MKKDDLQTVIWWADLGDAMDFVGAERGDAIELVGEAAHSLGRHGVLFKWSLISPEQFASRLGRRCDPDALGAFVFAPTPLGIKLLLAAHGRGAMARGAFDDPAVDLPDIGLPVPQARMLRDVPRIGDAEPTG